MTSTSRDHALRVKHLNFIMGIKLIILHSDTK